MGDFRKEQRINFQIHNTVSSNRKKSGNSTNIAQPRINKHLNALVAEDEEKNYLYIKEILEKNNIRTIQAISGIEAVNQCKKPGY